MISSKFKEESENTLETFRNRDNSLDVDFGQPKLVRGGNPPRGKNEKECIRTQKRLHKDRFGANGCSDFTCRRILRRGCCAGQRFHFPDICDARDTGHATVHSHGDWNDEYGADLGGE